MKDNTRIYLAGPINGRTDAECKDWRKWCETCLIRPVFDPMVRDYRGEEQAKYKEIVLQDKVDIDCSGCLLVYYDKPSVGTSMEIIYAYERRKPIYLVDASEGGKPLSPWLLFHATRIFRNLPEAVNFLNYGDSCPRSDG